MSDCDSGTSSSSPDTMSSSPFTLVALEELESELKALGAPREAVLAVARMLKNKSDSDTIRNWLSWCESQRDRVLVNSMKVSRDILPKHCDINVYDIKVGNRKRRKPDDALYNTYEDLRNRVARGNTILEITDLKTQRKTYECAIFALKKFTGGMGDEDEDDPGSQAQPKRWMDYFLKPMSSVERVVCTRKANGEAAHLSARWINDRFLLCIGSKNVHLLARRPEDLMYYRDSRYQVATEVAKSTFDTLNNLERRRVNAHLSMLHYTQLTAVFEILQPSYMHVEDLSHLSKPELNFITWTLPYSLADEKFNTTSHSAFAPDQAIDLGRALGLTTVQYDIINADDAEGHMDVIRRGHGYEGEVLYFVDAENNTIGLLKKKTAWYILCRAIREKVAFALSVQRKEPSKSVDDICPKVLKRMEEIQKWLGFPDAFLTHWKDLSSGFLKYMWNLGSDDSNLCSTVRAKFPLHWKAFLEASGKSDEIKWV